MNRRPNDLLRDIFIFVPIFITGGGHLPPLNCGISGLYFVGHAT
jgi:hypothetical protein